MVVRLRTRVGGLLPKVTLVTASLSFFVGEVRVMEPGEFSSQW